MTRYTHILHPAKFQFSLEDAIVRVQTRLQDWHHSNERYSEWDGVILKDGVPIVDVSTNNRVWELQPVNEEEYDKLTLKRAVWFGPIFMGHYKMILRQYSI